MSVSSITPTNAPTRLRLKEAWQRIANNRKVLIGLSIVIFFALIAIFGPVFIHTDPGAPGPDQLQAPSAAHWLGTTQLGQDVLVQAIIGTRLSMVMGFVIGALTMMISVIVGLVSGYFGGWIDEVLSLITNVFLVLPTLPLAILLAAFIAYKGPLTIGVVLTVTGWSWGARVMRSQTLLMRNIDNVDAARSSGETSFRIIFYEIFPNEIAIVASQFLGTIIYAILAETGLEFLGLGNINSISWGTMLYLANNGDALALGSWWWFLVPGLCIAILGAGLALINFGIDEIANPKLRAEPRSVVKKPKDE
jgi:peptide/nickel transport system permease protein